VVIVDGKANLLEVVLAGHPIGRFPDLLHGWEEQTDENGDNSDDDEQLNQRKPAAATHGQSSFRRTALLCEGTAAVNGEPIATCSVEILVPKLGLGTFSGNSVSRVRELVAKPSFAKQRSQPEFGNQEPPVTFSTEQSGLVSE
jgi:hypothetical protein